MSAGNMCDSCERLREKLRVAENTLEYYSIGGRNYKMAVETLAKIREVK